MKEKTFLKRAFSMLEMSVVILIVGLLVAGVTQSSRVINNIRLQTARSLTKSSVVGVTPDLIRWYESTLPESFLPSRIDHPDHCGDLNRHYDIYLNQNDDIPDTYYVNYWNDINPQASVKSNINGSQGDTDQAGCTMQYKKTGLNGLPSILFPAGFANSDWLGNYTSVTSDILRPKGNQFTVFVVLQLPDATSSTDRVAFYNGAYYTGSGYGFGYMKLGSTPGRRSVYFAPSTYNTNTTTLSTIQPEIITITCCNTTVTLSVNGTALALSSPASSYTPYGAYQQNLYMGYSGYGTDWQGYISEFIAYERVLTAAEITAITQYLSKKYRIKVS